VIRLPVTALLACFVVGCAQLASPLTCMTSDGKPIVGVLRAHTQEWDDTVTLASSTPRMTLAGPVGQLQRIRREVQSQQWPDCGRRAQFALVSTMDAQIDVFTSFMAQRSSAQSDGGRVERLNWEYAREYALLSGGPTPIPLPTVNRTAVAGTVTAASTGIAEIGVTMTAISVTSTALTRSIAHPPAAPGAPQGGGSGWLTSARATAFAPPP
jgi:hypothetical protein